MVSRRNKLPNDRWHEPPKWRWVSGVALVAGVIYLLASCVGCGVSRIKADTTKPIVKPDGRTKGPFGPIDDGRAMPVIPIEPLPQPPDAGVLRLEATASASLVETLLRVMGDGGDLSWQSDKPHTIELGGGGTMTLQTGTRFRYEIGNGHGKFVFAPPLPSVRAPAGPIKIRANLESVTFKADNTAEARVDLGLGIKRSQSFRIAFDDVGSGGQAAGGNLLPALPVVYCYTTAGCSACNQAKAAIEAAALSLPYSVKFTSQAPAWCRGFPTFHWADKAGKSWQRVGWPGLAELTRLVTDETSPAPGVSSGAGARYSRQGARVWTLTGCQTREALIEHLSNDGSHRGKFAREWLERLDYQSLVNLHSDDHEGRAQW